MRLWNHRIQDRLATDAFVNCNLRVIAFKLPVFSDVPQLNALTISIDFTLLHYSNC